MGSKQQTVTEKADPWGPSQPYLLDTMKTAQNLFRGGPNTVAPLDPNTIRGINMMTGAAGPMQEILNQAGGVMSDTMAGRFLNGSPYLDAQIARGSEGVADRVTSLFSGAGRYGSGAHQGVLGDSLADYDANMRYQSYENERQNMLRAGQFAPQLASSLLTPSSALLDAGSIYENKDAQYRAEPYDMLANFYTPIVQGTAGLGGTTTQKGPSGSRAGGALGGALAGAQLGSVFGPWGAGVGGVLGGLGGFF